MQTSRMISVSACGLVVLLALGCQQDEIAHYKVPRPETVKEAPPRGHGEQERMLAALLPRKDHTWFLKLQGPRQEVTAHEGDFERVLQSIHFDDQGKEPITWTTPEGWKREPGNELRYATLRLESKEKPLEMTISALAPSPADALTDAVLSNVIRWRGQLSLPPITKEELPKFTREAKVDGTTAIVVDFTGTGGGSKMPPFAGRMKPPAEPRGGEGPASPVKYEKPADWKELPAQPGGFRLAGFEVTEGSQRAEITIIPLGSQSGTLLDNVNRWRGQIGLEATSEENMHRDLQYVEAAGQRCAYVDLLGPESASPRRRMLGVIVPRGERTWYFKMVGPPELVGKQKPAFESFVKSVKFSGD